MDTSEIVLLVIDEYWRINSAPPTMRDVMLGSHLASTSVISYHLKRLRKRGDLLDMPGGKSRVIIPVWVRNALSDYLQKGKNK